MTGEPLRDEIDAIVAFVDARRLYGHPVHPKGCLCVPCNTPSVPFTTGRCGHCGWVFDQHNLVGVDAPVCPAGDIA